MQASRYYQGGITEKMRKSSADPGPILDRFNNAEGMLVMVLVHVILEQGSAPI